MKEKRIPRWRQKMLDLLPRAAMNEYELNTGVVKATNPGDNDFRFLITSARDQVWGDCAYISFTTAEFGRAWIGGHFSAARLRLIALQLLRYADVIEKRQGAKFIDKPDEYKVIDKPK